MAVINKDIAYMALPLSIRRGNPFPLDENSVWYDKELMEAYAASNPVAYVGQVLVLVNESEQTVEAYVIQNAAGTLMKLATSTSSGDLAADVLKLQGQVATLESSVGSKGAESAIVATDLWSALEEIKKAYETADTAINEKFNEYYNKTETDSKIDEKIASKISATYKAGGSIAFEALPELSAGEEGKVYNITNEFTTTENFIEGAGKKHPAGTNIVCIDTDDAGTYKWDVLAGFVDLSAYETTTSVDEKLNNKVDKVPGSSLVEDSLIAKLTGMTEIKGVNEEELTIDPESKILSILAISQDKVSGLTEALGQKVNVEAGKSLVQDSLITKLTGLAEIKTVSEEFSLSDGNLAVQSVNINKITQDPGSEIILNGGNATPIE